ncbi:MAG: dTDP-4-dehydrorhamnose reductase, partial [Planctomycetota bacterium]
MSSALPPTVIVGAAGMLGRAWRKLLDARGESCVGLDRPEIDITDAASVAAAIPPGTRVVVNCAAYTDVDACETHEADAHRVNADGPARLAERCAAVDAVLVHYSTDYVFAGDADTPYPVDAPIAPASAYGRTKAAGEAAIRDTGCRHLIVRTSWLYAPWGNNFVRTMLKLTAERNALNVVNDQRGRPTSAQHLAAVSKQLLDAEAEGTYHVTDGGECTWHGFTAEIARRAGPPHDRCDVRPSTTAAFPSPPPQPADSDLA